MPELPEVETVVKALQKTVQEKTVVSIREYRQNTIRSFTKSELSPPFRFQAIERRGKYILIRIEHDFLLIAHLRMTGKFIFVASTTFDDKYVRASFLFDDETMLLFRDVRTFGTLDFIDSSFENEYFKNLGVESLEDEFSAEFLFQKLRKRKAPIKTILLNQRIVAGLGNIYVSEILFRAGISPFKIGKELTHSDCEKIVIQTKQVLTEAILKNGTTINDFHNIDFKTGEFQNFLRVYQKKNCACGTKIEKVKQAGRSTYYCPVCQK
jgi:formamidopyrimidine-DNA glycosylase